MNTFQCPTCGSLNPLTATQCHECNEDLSTLKNVLDTANQHYNEAIALAQANKLDEAIGQIEAALAMAGQNANYYLLLGSIQAQKEHWEEAIQSWERCIALNPDMEKAYRNIEKAQQMSEDIEFERSRRPLILTTVGACIFAGIVLMATGFFAYQSYSKGKQILQLSDALHNRTEEARSWEQKYNTLNKEFPQEGLQGLLAQVNHWKTQAEQKDKSIQQWESRYKKSVEARNKEIQERDDKNKALLAQIANLRRSVNQINPLRHTVNLKNSEIEKKDKLIQQLRAENQAYKKQLEERKKELAETQNNLAQSNDLIKKTETAVRRELGTKIESLRADIQKLLGEIAEKDRLISDKEYADALVLESLDLIEANQFQEASARIEKALDRDPQHTLAQHVHQQVQSILSDPVERELRKKMLADRPSMRETIRTQWARQNLQLAQKHFEQGLFDAAVELAQNTLAFLPVDSAEARRCNQLIQQAEETEAKLTRQLSEARAYFSQQDYKKAKVLVRDILKRAPSFAGANDLMQQISIALK